MDIFYTFLNSQVCCVNINIESTVGDLKSKISDAHDGYGSISIIHNNEKQDDNVKLSSIEITDDCVKFNVRCSDCTSAEKAIINGHVECFKLSNMEMISRSNNKKYCNKCKHLACDCDDFDCLCERVYCECMRHCDACDDADHHRKFCVHKSDYSRLIDLVGVVKPDYSSDMLLHIVSSTDRYSGRRQTGLVDKMISLGDSTSTMSTIYRSFRKMS
jgi:hypothetical protein